MLTVMIDIWKKLYRLCHGDRLGGAILFYSALPWPHAWPVSFDRIARWIPLIGLLLAGLLITLGTGLTALGMGIPLQAGFLVLSWLWLTGGLHLDGVADSADGLAVTDPQKRLAVMKDSQTGAFGAMAIAAVMLLKVLALISFQEAGAARNWALVMALGWGRWGQLLAIAFYPYLRETGKGLMHRNSIRLPQDLLWGTAIIVLGSGLTGYGFGIGTVNIVAGMISSAAIAWGVGYWFARRFGGHTRDTYGAVVEWSEALILASLTLF